MVSANKIDNNRPKVRDVWPLVLLAVFYGFCISQGILSVTLVQMPAGKVFLIQAALIILLSVIFYRPLFFGIAAAVLGIALFIWLALNHLQIGPHMLTSFKEFFTEISGDAIYSARFDSIICFTVCFFSGILSVVFIVKISSFSAATALGLFVFGIKWMTEYDNAPYCFYVFLAVICALGLRRLNITMMRHSGKTGSTPSGLYTLITLPLCIALTAASFFAAPNKTTNIELLDSITKGKITTLSDFINVLTSESYGSVADSGFGHDNILGGDVTQDYTPVMEVSSGRSGTVYLSGLHSNSYTGTRWQNTLDTYQDMPPTISPSAEELNFLLTEPVLPPFRKNTVHIYPLKTTRTMFVPSGLVDISDKKAQISVSDDIRSFTAYRKGENYLTTSLEFDEFPTNRVSLLGMIPDYTKIPGEKFRFFDNNSRSFHKYYKRARGNIYNRTYLSPNELNAVEIYTRLIKYADFVYANYLELPESLPPRVVELANSIAVSYNEFSKVDEIRTFLNSYTYTLTPGDVPLGHDFTDYFLFDSKQGYCTYFATAMCIMARAVGVPSRYVEGYIAKNTVSNIKQTVTNADAHAWAECYFEGIGWVILEATPPYYQESTSTNQPNNSTESPEPSSTTSKTSSTRPSVESSISSAIPDSSSSNPVQSKGGHLWIFILCGSAVLLAAALIAAVLCNRRLRRKRHIDELKTAPANKAIATCFGFICRLAEADGNPRKNHETALQYGHRLSGIYMYGGNDMLTIAEIYSFAAYSDNGLGTENEAAARKTAIEFFDAMYADILERRDNTALRKFNSYLSRGNDSHNGGTHE